MDRETEVQSSKVPGMAQLVEEELGFEPRPLLGGGCPEV